MALLRPGFRNNILSRLHKIYAIGYTVAHHFHGVFDVGNFDVLTACAGHNLLAPIGARYLNQAFWSYS